MVGLGASLIPTSAAWADRFSWTNTPWLITENQRPGDATWHLGPSAPEGTLEPFAAAVAINPGDSLPIFVSSTSPHLTAKIYRLGYYQGHGARLVATVSHIAATQQPVPPADQLGTVDCHWSETFTITSSPTWSPGQYLVRLEDHRGRYRFLPFLVRSSTPATFLYVSAVTTWQAYNTWGGYSLYREASPLSGQVITNARRAERVSFNRPYGLRDGNGASDLFGNEYPLLFLLEQWGVDVAYATDLDLHHSPLAPRRHRAVLSLGHDEYYSSEMRLALSSAVEHGVNVAFFGANFIYRKVRFEPSVNGPDRLMVNYRSVADPITQSDPGQSTVNWADYPIEQPSSTFTGSSYGGAYGTGDLTVSDARGWLWAGAGVHEGQRLIGALGGEFNHYDPRQGNPPRVQLFGHSHVQGGVSDVTYVAQPGRGGVWSSGTGQWIYHLNATSILHDRRRPKPPAITSAALIAATRNVLSTFATGPAGNAQPSNGNTAFFYRA